MAAAHDVVDLTGDDDEKQPVRGVIDLTGERKRILQEITGVKHTVYYSDTDTLYKVAVQLPGNVRWMLINGKTNTRLFVGYDVALDIPVATFEDWKWLVRSDYHNPARQLRYGLWVFQNGLGNDKLPVFDDEKDTCFLNQVRLGSWDGYGRGDTHGPPANQDNRFHNLVFIRCQNKITPCNRYMLCTSLKLKRECPLCRSALPMEIVVALFLSSLDEPYCMTH